MLVRLGRFQAVSVPGNVVVIVMQLALLAVLGLSQQSEASSEQ